MNRYTPLRAKKPWRPNRKPMRKISPRRQAENAVYDRERKKFLAARPYCAIRSKVCTERATCVHHPRGRIGPNYLNVQEWMPSCWPCNDYVEKHKTWATQRGFRLDRIGRR